MPTKTASRVMADGTRKQTFAPSRALRLTESDVKEPATLHRFLSHFLTAHEEISKAHRSNSRMRATVYEGLKFTAGSDLAPIQHSFGVVVRYQPVRWIGATTATACQFAEVVNDGARLILHAITTGTCDLEIWPV